MVIWCLSGLIWCLSRPASSQITSHKQQYNGDDESCNKEFHSWEKEAGKTEEGGKAKKKKVEKPQDGRQKSGQNIGNPYQMEDNKAAPSAPPQGGGASRRPLGVVVVFHLVRISYVLA